LKGINPPPPQPIPLPGAWQRARLRDCNKLAPDHDLGIVLREATDLRWVQGY